MAIDIHALLARHQPVPENAAFFLPAHGIGDKLRFFSYLHLFEIFNGYPARLLVAGDLDRSLVTCFPELADRTLEITPEAARSMYADGRLATDRVSTQPGPGLVFATWHLHYLNGQGWRWEAMNQPLINHDLFVKQMLHVPAVFSPAKLVLPAAPRDERRRVLLAPLSVSSQPTPQALWLDLAERLTAAGFSVVCNVALGNRPQHYQQDYTDLFGRYDALDIPLNGLIGQLDGYAGAVTSRSGLSDLLSLSALPSVTLTPDSVPRFWDITNYGNKHREIRLTQDIDAPAISADIVRFLSA